VFLVDLLFLGYIGGNVAEDPFIFAGRVASFFYFLFLFLLEFPVFLGIRVSSI
jgi:hypothetical protein